MTSSGVGALFRLGSAAFVSGVLTLLLAGCATPPPRQSADPLAKINHFIIIFQENWSFDALYGKFPGANGLANAGETIKQVDKNGVPYRTLPQPVNSYTRQPDARFPADLPVAPFDLAQYVKPEEKTGDLVHRFYQQQLQINGGKMDKFVAWSDAAGLVMSYYDATNMPEGKLAQEFVMADNFFHAAFGGSFLNHFWLICACTPRWESAPADVVVRLDVNGMMIRDGQVTPDGYAVNTAHSVFQPHPKDKAQAQLIPPQTAPTIGDRLNAQGITWAWYAGGWTDALAGKPAKDFQYHHHPFAYFANYGDGTALKAKHLKDEQDFMADLRAGTLPQVAFIKPIGANNEHPGYANLARGQQHVADLVNAVRQSKYWRDAAIIITYDENGGRWDHVPPPKIDRWGPGTRVPAIIVSPHAKRGYVDHTQYDTTSIIRTLAKRFGLAPLTSRDAQANDMSNAFQ